MTRPYLSGRQSNSLVDLALLGVLAVVVILGGYSVMYPDSEVQQVSVVVEPVM